MEYEGKWDLESIYPDGIADDIARLEKAAGELKSLSEADAPLADLIGRKDFCDTIAVSLTAYTDACLSVDSADEAYLKNAGIAEKAVAGYSEAEDAFVRAVGRSSEEAPDGFGYYIGRLRQACSHLMTPAEEALAEHLAISGSSAWERLQESLSSSICESGRTLSELRSDASSPSRSIRKESYGRELRLLESHGLSFASALNGVKGTVLLLDRKRGWASPLERSLYESAFSGQSLDIMIRAIEEALPVFREYFRIKARLLGVDDFSFYDLFAPIGGERSFSFGNAMDIVYSSYGAFSQEMEDFAREAAERRWIDSLMHKGKAGGAYDVYFPNVRESRIFLNFDSSYDSVLTLAHELGHGYHDRVLSALPPSRAEYPMTLAETASVFAEKLVFQHVLSMSHGNEEIFILDAFLQSASQVMVDILSRFIFEREVFERRDEGPLSGEEFCRIMEDAQRRTYGDALARGHRYMWAVKSHYYSADFSFYNYPYAFGEFFSLALLAKAGEPGYAERYRDMLSFTGQKDADGVAAMMGFDVYSDKFFRIGIDYITKIVERLASWS